MRSSVEVAKLDELEQILRENRHVDVVDDPELISREIVEQLLAAETDAELFGMGQASGWRELEGQPMELHGFRWRPSAFEEGSSVFFVVTATRLTDGERVVLTTGSRNVLAQLVNLARRGQLEGKRVRLVRSARPTANGFHPLWLEELPAPGAPAA